MAFITWVLGIDKSLKIPKKLIEDRNTIPQDAHSLIEKIEWRWKVSPQPFSWTILNVVHNLISFHSHALENEVVRYFKKKKKIKECIKECTVKSLFSYLIYLDHDSQIPSKWETNTKERIVRKFSRQQILAQIKRNSIHVINKWDTDSA